MRFFVVCFLCGAFMAAQSSFAFVAPHKKQYEALGVSTPAIFQRILRPELKKSQISLIHEQESNVETHLDTHSGAVRLLSGRFSVEVSPDKIEASSLVLVAEEFIDSHKEIFGVSSSDLHVVPESLYVGEDTQFVQFRVMREGLLIKDAGIDFRFKAGHLVQIVNDSYSEAEIISSLDSNEDFDALVSRVTQAEKLEQDGFAYRVEKVSQGYQLVKVARYLVKTKLNDDLSVEVKTSNGEIFELHDRKFYLKAKATTEIYPRWYNEPLSTVPLSFHKFKVSNKNIYADVMGHFEMPVQKTPSITRGLSGSFVSVITELGVPFVQKGVLVENAWQIHAARASKDRPWMSQDVSQSMAYYHITSMVQEARKYIDVPWLRRPVKSFVNVDDTCNANWDGINFNFFSGNSQCANTALIADIIYHEWGHGLDAMAGGIQDGAFSEGFGDILSFVMTQSPVLGIGFKVKNHASVRNLEANHTYPKDQGEVHDEGLIIGSTFWDLFEIFSRQYDHDKAAEILKNYAFKMILTARTYLDVYQALLVIDDNDVDLTNGTPHKCVLNKVFNAHGLTAKDAACL